MGSFSIERVVTLLTPFFAAGASLLTAWLSTKVGINVNSSDVEGVMAAAFLGTVAIVFKWLHGRQIPEIAGLTLSQAQVDQVREQVTHHLAAMPEPVAADIDAITKQVFSRIAAGVATPAPNEAAGAPQVTSPAT